MDPTLEIAALERLLWIAGGFLAVTVAAVAALVASDRVAPPPTMDLRGRAAPGPDRWRSASASAR
jgi:hypothetical protein